ncbi:MAG: phage tail tape measure protein [Desulfatirhabdiaceae bacterium]
MGDKVQNLGVNFTGDITDISGKVKELLALLSRLDAASKASSRVKVSALSKDFSQNKVMLSEFQLAAGKAVNETKKFQEALAAVAYGKSGTALKTIDSQLRQVERSIVVTAQKMNQLGKAGDKFYETANRVKILNDVISGKTKVSSSGISTVSAPVIKEPKVPSVPTKNFSDQIKNAAAVTLAYGIAGTVIGGFVAALKSGAENIVEFDQALHNLQAITSATNDEVAVMGKTIKEVAQDPKNKYSIKELADGMTLIGQAGFSAAEATTMIGPAAQLATGTLSKMEETVDLLSTTLVAFNMEASESGRVTDVMAAAVNKSKLTVDQLRTVFNYVGSSAHMTGMSVEELAASTMVLANNGLRASTIGTGLRQVLAKLLSPGEKLREAFESHGIALDSVNPKVAGYQQAMKNMIPILWDVEKKTVDMSKAYELFELRGAQAAAVLINGFAKGGFGDALNDTLEVGMAAEMAAKQAEGLGVMWSNLVSRAGVLAVAIGDLGITGALRIFIDAARMGVTAATQLAEGMKSSFSALFSATDTAKKKAGEQVVENKAVIGSLEVYKSALGKASDELKKGDGVNKEHISVLKRLIADHPELASQVNLTRVSFESLGGVITAVNKLIDEHDRKIVEGLSKKSGIVEKSVSDLERRKASIEKIIAALNSTADSDERNGAPSTGSEKRKTELNTYTLILKKINDELKASTEELSETAGTWADKISKQFSGKDNAAELSNDVVASLQEMGTVSESTAKTIREKLAESFKHVSYAVDTSKFTTRIKTMGKDFDDVFKKLDPGKRLDFIKKFGDLEKYISGARKTYGNTDIPGEDVEADISAKKKAFLEEYLKKEAKAEESETNRASQEAQKRIQIQESYYATVAKLTSDAKEKLEQERLKESENIKKQYEEAILYAKQHGGDLAAIKAKYDGLQGQNDQFYRQKGFDEDQKKALALLEIEIIKRKQLNEEKKKASIDDTGGLASIKRGEAEVTIAGLEEEMQIRKEYRDKTLENYKEGSAQAIAAEKDYQQAVLALGSAVTDEEIRQHELRVQQTVKELKMKLKMVQEYSVEYYRIMEELRRLGEITEPLSYEERLAGSPDWVDGIRLGLIRAAKEQKTQAQNIADIWQNATASIGDGFATLFDDVLVGKVKSAGDYIVSFLQSVVKSINNVLASQIGNAISTGIGGMFSSSTSAASVSARSNILTPYAEGGWITEPIIGRGIRTGKGYSFGEKGDELVSPASQVQGRSEAPNVAVIVNNKTGSDMKAQQSTARFDGEKWVVSVVLDAVQRNVGGLRTALGG